MSTLFPQTPPSVALGETVPALASTGTRDDAVAGPTPVAPGVVSSRRTGLYVAASILAAGFTSYLVGGPFHPALLSAPVLIAAILGLGARPSRPRRGGECAADTAPAGGQLGQYRLIASLGAGG